MIGAALSPGETMLVNAACDPEIEDVANYLNKMGAKISRSRHDNNPHRGREVAAQVSSIVRSRTVWKPGPS